MLSSKLINDFMVNLGLEEYNLSVERSDDSGDFIQMYCPELDFVLTKNSILNTKLLSENITDIGPDAVFMVLKSKTDDGFTFFYDAKVVSGSVSGVRISIATKRIEYYDNDGKYKPFISFEMMKAYLNVFGAINV